MNGFDRPKPTSMICAQNPATTHGLTQLAMRGSHALERLPERPPREGAEDEFLPDVIKLPNVTRRPRLRRRCERAAGRAGLARRRSAWSSVTA